MALNRFKFGGPGPPNQVKLTLSGPIVQIRIAIPDALERTMAADKTPIPQPVSGWALVDTGATGCAVDAKIIESLAVMPIDTIKSASVHGIEDRNVYPGKIILMMATGEMAVEHKKLVGVDLSGQIVPGVDRPLIALLGRDFLANFVMHYDGPEGQWALYS